MQQLMVLVMEQNIWQLMMLVVRKWLMKSWIISIEEFMEDLPIQDELEEEFALNQEDSDEEEEEDIWKVPSDELFLEPDYLLKFLDNHFRKRNANEDLPIEMEAAIDLLSLP